MNSTLILIKATHSDFRQKRENQKRKKKTRKHVQKNPLQNFRCSKFSMQVLFKTTVLESPLNKVVGLQSGIHEKLDPNPNVGPSSIQLFFLFIYLY